jgi:DNA-binding GntR family transcriptional regulator
MDWLCAGGRESCRRVLHRYFNTVHVRSHAKCAAVWDCWGMVPVPTSQPAADRELLRDRVRNMIRDAIMDGTLEPGERLHDDDLIAWLGVSRTPIREALAELAGAGLIDMAPNRYTRVTSPNKDELLDACRTLGVVYGGVVRLAVPRFTDAQRTTITDTLARAIDRTADGGLYRVVREGASVYDLWADACGNNTLANLCRSVTTGLAYKLRVPQIHEVLDVDSVRREMINLRNAVIAIDPIAAELAMEATHQLPTR